MLRRRIRKRETAWRKLCRFLCFSAPIHWGARVASAIRPVRAAAFFSAPADRGTRTAAGVFAPNGREVFRLKSSEELRSAERGRLRRPPQGAKRKGHLRFPFLFELLPFPYFLVWRRLPTCDRSEKGNDSRVTLAFVSQNIRSSQTAYCYTGGLINAECGITVPHNSSARCYRQDL